MRVNMETNKVRGVVTKEGKYRHKKVRSVVNEWLLILINLTLDTNKV